MKKFEQPRTEMHNSSITQLVSQSCCFSLSFVTVNKESLGFGQKEKTEGLIWTVGKCDEHCSHFLTFTKLLIHS